MDQPQTTLDTHGLTGLGYLILMDRYALKTRGEANVGDLVIAIINNDGKDMGQKRELGFVEARNGDTVTVRLTNSEEIVELPLSLLEKPLEITPQQITKRVAHGIASAEKTQEKRDEWGAKFEWLLDDFKFVAGGRIIAAAGTGQNLTAFNCYVVPNPHDSRAGILKTLGEMTEIMSRGGGVGINVSSLRPKNAQVVGVNGRSSGSVSWGGLYSFVTGLIEQGGSRRGALMLMLNDWHPDLFRFINSKKNAGNITNANISVAVSDAFMEAVKTDSIWQLRFPETNHPAYNTEWNGDLAAWEAKGYPIKVHQEVKATEIWDTIVESAWASAEPGIWFQERANKMSNSNYYQQGINVCTNPCAEQGLPPYGICNLGAINLSKFATKEGVDYYELEQAVRYGVRFLDNVIDINYYFMPENEKQEKGERRIGLGIMGLAEMLITLGLRYGSKKGIEFTEHLFKFIAEKSYEESAYIASEKGSFPYYEEEGFLNSGYMQNMAKNGDPKVIEAIKAHGMRNVTVLTVAPTGSTGTMVNTSTGIEPYFSWEFYRKGRLGLHKESVPVVSNWLTEQGIDPNSEYTLPPQFVTAMELTPEEHVRMQAAAQKWVDSSISKTCNAPNDYTIEQTKDLYQMLYDLGCKGGTIYRDGSRDEQVLSLTNDDKKEDKTTTAFIQSNPPTAEVVSVTTTASSYITPEKESHTLVMEKRGAYLSGRTFKGITPYGNVLITVNEDADENPFEILITIAKSGSDLAAQAESIGRLMSAALQMQPTGKRLAALKEFVKQMRGIGGARQVGFGANRVASFPDAVAKIIDDQYITQQEIETEAAGYPLSEVRVEDKGDVPNIPIYTDSTSQQLSVVSSMGLGNVMSETALVKLSSNGHSAASMEKQAIKMAYADICPECQNQSLQRQDGCKKCSICGYSEC